MSARFRMNAACTAALAGMALAVPAHAAVFVDWNGADHGGNSLTLSRDVEVTVGDFDDDGNADDSQVLVPFSMTEALNPAINPPNYNDADSAVFYGGQKYVFTDNTSPQGDAQDYQRVYHNRGFLRSAVYSRNSASASLATVYVWDKSGFLNDGDITDVSLDETSSLTFDVGVLASQGTGRFVIRTAGDQYFISESVSNGGSGLSLSGADLVNEMWASYDPYADIEFDSGGADFNISTASLSNITGFGVYGSVYNAPSGGYNFAVGRFTVDAVPEPASIGLMLGGAALMLLRRRSVEA